VKPNPVSETVCTRPLLVGAMFLGLFVARLSAQAPPSPEPVRNAIVFTLRISGSGSDPAPTVNSGISLATQHWSYERTIEGWFEVNVARRREGVGAAARELVEFTRKRGGRHQIIGIVSDRVWNYERWYGEGYETGVYADYRASESADWTGALLPADTGVVLDSTHQTWIRMFDPQMLLGDYRPMMNYLGEAYFAPSTTGGFGEPWTYTTDDPALKLAGEKKQIMTRYHPGERGFTAVFPDAVALNVPAKFDGTVATGRVEYVVPKPDSARGTWTRMHYVVDWAARTELPDVELEVRSPNYETWRPTATTGSAAPGSGRASGPGLNFAAELRRVDGNKNAPLPKIRSLEWRLSDTSREPGIALNFPYRSDDKRLDLEIVAGDLTEPEDATAQAVVVRSPGDPINEATVLPYDWGGWTTLRVTAKLDDGRTIEGILRGGASGHGLKAIRVPATTPGSKIAWSWLREFCPDWRSDADDEDPIPVGKPGVDGDGFSVYEEYRGFYGLLGTHFSTTPRQKDLFVRLDNFNAGTSGVFRFFALSGLEKRFLRPDQLPRAGANERVVNCNVGAGATCGPQTALYVVETAGFSSSWGTPIPSGSRPATVPSVEAKTDVPSFLARRNLQLSAVALDNGQAVRDSILVRSLFQAVGVDRPGRPAGVERLAFVSAPEAADSKPHYLLNGKRVVILTESGDDHAIRNSNALVRINSNLLPGEKPHPSPAYSVVVGTPGSAHSGPEDCVMRDWFADLYLSHTQRDGVPVYKYTLGTERPGTQLGTTRKGTGINDAKRPLGSRYGDSAVAAPANRQLVVKDQAP